MPLRILLVEDDPISSDVIASLLSVRGHTVETAEDGFGATRMARDASYDLILVDYHLPEMDGYALARVLRSLCDRTGAEPSMVALTADRFGLAARRGADAIFDRILAKPIEPDMLFALTDTIEAARPKPDVIDAFLAAPVFADARSASSMLWRARGLSEAPAAAVFPTPTAAEESRLSCCFRLVHPEAAECLLLLGPKGVAGIEALRVAGENYLVPSLALDPGLADRCEATFSIGDGGSWSTAVECLAAFAQRRETLLPATLATSTADERLLAFLYVCDRPIRLRRDRFGRTDVLYGGGFSPSVVIEAIRRLAAKGLVRASPPRMLTDGARELEVGLAASAVEHLQLPRSRGSAER